MSEQVRPDWMYHVSLALSDSIPDSAVSKVYDIVEAQLEQAVAEKNERIGYLSRQVYDLMLIVDVGTNADPGTALQQLRTTQAEAVEKVWETVGVVLSGFGREIRKTDLIAKLEAARDAEAGGGK